MLKYITTDLTSMLCYLPFGLVAAILAVIILCAIRNRRVKMGKTAFSVAAYPCFFTYAAIMLMISFLSRESGSTSRVDMEFLSTWGINNRNKAYLIENIIFFVPYGFVSAWALNPARRWLVCTSIGALTSLGIECMQLVTGRGVFQVDDMITNTLGAFLGYLLFRCVTVRRKK